MVYYKLNNTGKMGKMIKRTETTNLIDIRYMVFKNDDMERKWCCTHASAMICPLTKTQAWVYDGKRWDFLSVVKLEEGEKLPEWKDVFLYITNYDNSLVGFNDKNERFFAGMRGICFVVLDGKKGAHAFLPNDLSFAVLQRGAGANYDIVFCFHEACRVLKGTFHTKDKDSDLKQLKNMLKNRPIFDVGHDPYPWKKHLSLAKKERWDLEDWKVCFADTDDDDDEFKLENSDDDDEWSGGSEESSEDDDEEFEEAVAEESDEEGEEESSEYELTDASSVSSDDMRGPGGFESDEEEDYEPSTKKRKTD